MMQSFTYSNPTTLHFGEGQLEKLTAEIPKYGTKVLLVYGGGSIKRNGIYDQVIKRLNEINVEIVELSGVEPNPRLSTVHRGVDLVNEHNIDFLLAVGGGSVIDCTKAIAVGAKYDGDVWDIITKKTQPKEALPLGTILTIAATGSEMNSSSVITNWETNEKYGWGSPLVFPKFSILDPTFTASLPKDHTTYGMIDMMAHVFEQYFHHEKNTPVQDQFAESILRTVKETAPLLLDDLTNKEYRSTVLYCGTLALNGTLSMGLRGDWATHNIEHAVSAVFDIPHGAGLAILFPAWMEYCLEENVTRFTQLATRVFGVNPEGKSDLTVAKEGIQAIRDFWTSIGAPSKLSDYHIKESDLPVLVEKAMANGPFGRFKTLQAEDVLAIYKRAL